MRLLLTGATGFLGSHILDNLIEKDFNVSVIIRPDSKKILRNISDLEQIITTNDLFSESQKFFRDSLQNIDIVIHAAWYVEHGKYLQSTKNLDCFSGTVSFAKVAANLDIEKFIGIGTCFEYKQSNEPLGIDSELRPESVYASAKADTYLMLDSIFREKEIDFAWCRLFYLYGDREDPNRLIPYIRNQLSNGKIASLTSGSQIRDFLNIKDAAEAIVEVAIGDNQGPVNICSGIPLSVKDLAIEIAKEYDNGEKLLKFGDRDLNYTDPPFVVGIPNYR